MTIAKLSASPVYFAHVLPRVPLAPRSATSSSQFNSIVGAQKHATSDWLHEWLIPLLTLLGTAAAMWFVVTEGWFQLFGFWAS